MSTVTMQDLELETAELLPARETLNACGRSHGGSSTTVTTVTGSFDGNGDGNGLLSVLSGNLDGDLDGNNVFIL
jgi:hypothetical protein